MKSVMRTPAPVLRVDPPRQSHSQKTRIVESRRRPCRSLQVANEGCAMARLDYRFELGPQCVVPCRRADLHCAAAPLVPRRRPERAPLRSGPAWSLNRPRVLAPSPGPAIAEAYRTRR